jgi:hypothetical protein
LPILSFALSMTAFVIAYWRIKILSGNEAVAPDD